MLKNVTYKNVEAIYKPEMKKYQIYFNETLVSNYIIEDIDNLDVEKLNKKILKKCESVHTKYSKKNVNEYDQVNNKKIKNFVSNKEIDFEAPINKKGKNKNQDMDYFGM